MLPTRTYQSSCQWLEAILTFNKAFENRSIKNSGFCENLYSKSLIFEKPNYLDYSWKLLSINEFAKISSECLIYYPVKDLFEVKKAVKYIKNHSNDQEIATLKLLNKKINLFIEKLDNFHKAIYQSEPTLADRKDNSDPMSFE
jgi:hypothetical protein